MGIFLRWKVIAYYVGRDIAHCCCLFDGVALIGCYYFKVNGVAGSAYAGLKKPWGNECVTGRLKESGYLDISRRHLERDACGVDC